LTHRLGNLCHDVAAVPLEYGAVRRFPMRFEIAWGGEVGLPHGRTAVAWNLFHVRDTSRRAVAEEHGLVICACGLKSTLRTAGRRGFAATGAVLWPSPQPPPAVTRVLLIDRPLAGGGVGAAGPRPSH
jgi:hypothetical protein